ncbi:MAG: MFS transporter [Candidatus Sericytochromatia bacterium]|nr:MFS transporter [Candidatus Sericytochromatia bacterium]
MSLASPAPASSPRRAQRQAVVAAAVGSAIEWYDFFLYGVAAALVFPKVFFPASDPYTGVLLAFSTYFVGFLARPIGAAVFGHWGDRIGRKATLVATLVLMGLSTVAIGLVPTHASLGVWAGALLVVLRLLQGIGVGGEWGGAVLLAMEWADDSRRGLMASWPQFGVAVGLVLANAALAFAAWWSGDQFLTWGWRVPFLLSVGLIGVGFWIRLGIQESPEFLRLQAQGQLEAQPVRTVLREHGREVLLTALARSGQQAPFYVFTAFVLDYGTRILGQERQLMLNLVMLASCLMLVSVPFWAHLSDRIGRRRMMLLGSAAMVPFSFLYFGLLDTRDAGWMALAIAVSLPVHDMQYGPQAAFIAESFPTHLRYSGASLGYQLASITSGGPAPLLALWLFEATRSSVAIAAFMALFAAVGFLAILLLRPDASAPPHALGAARR